MAKEQFVHLHTHSHYSLLNALPKTKELVEAAAKDNMPALALTDSGNLYGALEFYKECKKQGIKPIIGVDAYVAARTRFDKESGIDNKRHRLVLLAKNTTGYKNLLKLVTASYLEGFYYKPRMDRELLQRHAGGLIVIIPSFSGEVATALRAREAEKARAALQWHKATFGADDVYLEITHHPEIEGHQNLMKEIAAFAKEADTPLVAAHDTYYLKPEDRLARETMLRIQSGGGESRGGFDDAEEDFSFITTERANQYFADMPEAIKNTLRIAERCNLELELGTWVFPDYKTKNGTSYEDELARIVRSGIVERGIANTPEVEERIKYELDVINAKGYAPYFLAVADLLRFARLNNILTTTRGSAAGSMVSFATGITNVDPMHYLLPFERFLNPYRPSPPDVDMDFADDRRDEVIQYAKDTYGEDNVAQIGTFGTMMARAVIRDVARALDHPYGLGDRIAKLIPFGSQGFPMTIDHAFEIVPELADAYEKEKDVREIIDLGKKIEGCARHISVHAAGVVIAPKPLVEYTPLQFDPKGGHLITQYNMHSIEDAGLLKFDFLGLKNLSILSDAVGRVEETSDTAIDIENIPLDDEQTFDTLSKGETMGLFQLNGAAMTRYLKELQPTTVHDINAMVALYRPGPMNNIPEYISRKRGEHATTYYHPSMEKFLDKSYGILVYQDDLLFTALETAGYNWESVDKFRKAVGKKIPAEMAKQHEIFVKGCMEHSEMSKKQAEGLWKLFEPFQGYGFNKAHAASYGKVAYQTAYMKTHYPVEYMAAILTADAGDVEKVAEAISECVRLGIPVLPPDINESVRDFTVVPQEDGSKKIRFGLYTIKNFGEGIAQAIIEEREQNGKFKSLADFIERVHGRNLNRKSLEALIKAGALDSFNERGAMLEHIELLLAYSREHAQTAQNQDSLFGGMPESESALHLPPAEPARREDKLKWEKELLGIYLSGHPLDRFREKFEKQDTDIKKIKETNEENAPIVIGGIIEESKQILTKNNERMVFMRVADFSDSIETVVFPRVFVQYKELLAPETCIAIKGRFSNRNGSPSIIVEAIKKLG